MELNVEKVKKALECCNIAQVAFCDQCPYNSIELADNEICSERMANDAIALFKSYEQRIFELENRLKECENGYEGTLYLERAKIKKLTDERDTFREYAYNMQKYVEYIKHNEEAGYEPSAAKAAAEMEMWRVVALQKRELIEENERLGIENFDLICKLSRIKEDTVREFVERLKAEIKRFAVAKFTSKTKNPDFITKDVAIWFIDQIAKEMVEGVCDTTN